MLKEIENFTKEFLEKSKGKTIRIISHLDTDGVTSAAILVQTLKRLDKKFSIKIVKTLEQEIIEKELQKKNQILFFTDLASNSLEHFENSEQPIFILDHHEINKEKLEQTNKKNQIKIINPHLFKEFENQEICGAELSYLFAKSISKENKDLAKLAIIGRIGDRQEKISKITQQILNDSTDLEIRKGLIIFSATRPLRRVLEYSTTPYIPGVTGSSVGVSEILRHTNISPDKTISNLTKDEMSKLVTEITIRKANHGKKEEIVGNIYLMKFHNRKEDVRELSVLINACSRLGYSDVALAFCLENPKAKTKAEEIYVKYKQQLVSALRFIEKLEKIKGNGFVIMNAKDEIKDTIIGTVTSILSSGLNYEEGTILIGMAYNQDKIKVSARIAGREGRNLREVLERALQPFKDRCKIEIGGHQNAAGCLIEKKREKEFIDELRKNLEIEVMKI